MVKVGGNSQKEFLFFLRSSGKSMSKTKKQREQQNGGNKYDNTKQSNENAQWIKGRRY